MLCAECESLDQLGQANQSDESRAAGARYLERQQRAAQVEAANTTPDQQAKGWGLVRILTGGGSHTEQEKLRGQSRALAGDMTMANWTFGLLSFVALLGVASPDARLGSLVLMVGIVAWLLTYVLGALRQIVRLLADIHERVEDRER